ncbi:sulfatase-like hydrolase/transferase [Variovorax sp. J31P207]|uniref:sulfatase-like hydrolase/transferase n=1 Tax=Variovorax sp. J31P207 TaxID=3053510 RepID=UPI002574F8A3|nr:sulfatase-like hydrolase/transferase [Variovorax sp. J31P207]MDM0068069.1 sulfatase-like hydrolase/transferase [Variovorax sp. J31P207]
MVIVLLESVRAVSTTVHSPGVATTPFLKQLADKGMQVEDMNSVIPRTAAAWTAVLTARLMQGYEALGVLDDTVFVFLGDHGQLFGEHGLSQRFNAIYQEGIHVPAILYAPGLITPNRRISGSRQQIDILPTVVELLGYRIETTSGPIRARTP